MSVFSEARQSLQTAFAAIGQVVGDDGRPLVESRGADPRDCEEWRKRLRDIDEELIIWSRTFKKVYGSRPEPVPGEFEADDEELDLEESEDDDYDRDLARTNVFARDRSEPGHLNEVAD